MKRRQGQGMAGFTLMELLVVVIIIGILATLALPQFPRVMESARQAEARNILGQIYQAERMYYAENVTYVKATPSANPLVSDLPNDASTSHYFKYEVTDAAAATFSIKATRKISTDTGRTPSYSSAYTITLNQKGEYSTSNF
ncbi:MAG: prepilin-type N-terminal cleavage/methylation domain-containing protein [Candidatus Omnitrophica bacterium]|nr:prepilin-type N-terminal cleavage/methylation domain-containing protein [Candidatus Omnitrophota bacterium]